MGAVSEETVVKMVKGVMETLGTDYAVATSGIAGLQEVRLKNLSARFGWLPGNKEKILTAKLTEDEGREKYRLQRQNPAIVA